MTWVMATPPVTIPNPEPTPNIDRLAREGMRFTDAHSPASWCVPTRYGMLTGRYPHRADMDWRRKAVIEEGRTTVGSALREQGYSTAMVGKWHLGFVGGPDYDYTKPLVGGRWIVGLIFTTVCRTRWTSCRTTTLAAARR